MVREPDLEPSLHLANKHHERVDRASGGTGSGLSCPHDQDDARPNDRAGLAQVSELRRWQIDVLGDALLPALG